MTLQAFRECEPIPGYSVTERIGAGGYGEVWKAEAPGGLSKAIKFVYGLLDGDRAVREMKALERIKQVRHPFLLSLERFEVVEGQLIIVTELADMSLKDRFDACRAEGLPGIPRAELLGHLHDAADALDYMRLQHSLQHLDVKPENLLLVGGRVKVADFGLVKELHDPSASMMGGLTPVYAPPEVFDGRPCEFSDQYSLAIVFQELLTGVLPFPGRTAAQLAAQHLQSRPRLLPLPQSDQPIIARALTKNPEQRFASCRELVDALLDVGRSQVHRVGGNSPAVKLGSSDTTSLRQPAMAADTRPKPMPVRTPPRPPQPTSLRTQPLIDENEPVRNPTRSHSSLGLIADPQPLRDDLEPIDAARCQAGLRPTLFLGIGGTAARTLRRLRQRLTERFGELSKVPALQMLLFDTDTKALANACKGEQGFALTPHDVLALPLRKPQDYRANSQEILQWLGRRWLYNIPRTLQTEGLRPLGRLAMVDHWPALSARLKAALETVVDPQSAEVSSEQTGRHFRDQTPRVFLISSISGGTGSGIVLDLAYAVRKVLADLGVDADNGICGILTHSTERCPSARDLAMANAFACLSELNHFSRHGQYPGEAACGLPAFGADAPPFSHAYLLHLGEELSEPEFDAATDALAEYLCLDATTAGGAFLDHCRQLSSAESGGNAPSLRTFGICQIGSGQMDPGQIAELLCQSLVRRWCGEQEELPEDALPDPLRVRLLHEHQQADHAREHAELDQAAEDRADELGLSVEHVIEQIYANLEAGLGSAADAYFQTVLQQFFADDSRRSATEQQARRLQLVRSIDVVLGPRGSQEDAAKSKGMSLSTTLQRQVEALSLKLGAGLCDWIIERVDATRSRARGACRSADWFLTHLRSLETSAGEMLSDVQADLARLEARMEIQSDGTSSRGWLSTARAAKHTDDDDEQLLHYFRCRLHEMALKAVRSLCRSLISQVTATADRLKELRRSLGDLAASFAADDAWETGDGPTAADALNAARRSMFDALRSRMPQLAHELDQRLSAELLGQHGGLYGAFNTSQLHTLLPDSLRHEARAAVMKAFKEIAISHVIAGNEQNPQDRLRSCLESASPRLSNCGGSQRLLVVLPEGSARHDLPGLLRQVCSPSSTILSETEGDLVFCYEAEQLPLARVAGQLIKSRSDYAEVAQRLHTRVDIDWSTLADFG